ncbi:MAG TPA: NlpC/P60 family protein [Acidimicrobiales bacterium]|nr:NlpC/P60 family protein [Acidimicrobiales bacterium]
MPEGLAALQARIGEIQQRFSPAPPTSSSSAGPDFATALATAQTLAAAAGDEQAGAAGLGTTGSVARFSQLGGLSDLGGLSGLPGLSGLGGRATWSGGATSGAGDVLGAAQRYLGVPYRWGGTDPATGLDCSGFVQRVFRDVGVDLPRVSRDQATAGRPVASIDQAQPGDLIAFGSPVDHIGIYAGNGMMVVAPHTGDVVKFQEVYRTPTAIRRVLPDAGAQAAPWAPAGGVAGGGAGQFAAAFAAAESANGLPAGLLRAVAATESGFNPSASSPAGAQGLMQLMPATARALGVDPLDPPQAIDGAARLLAGQLQRFGSLDLALAAYNAGGPAVARAGGIPPYPETRAYVARVLSRMTDGAS